MERPLWPLKRAGEDSRAQRRGLTRGSWQIQLDAPGPSFSCPDRSPQPSSHSPHCPGVPCPTHGTPALPRPVLARGESGLSCLLGPLRALGGRHWSPASSWQGASSTAVRPPTSVRSPSGDARPARPVASPSACGWACSRRVSTGPGPWQGLGEAGCVGLERARSEKLWRNGLGRRAPQSEPPTAPWTQPCPTIQGVRLDRVRGGRQKYKRRPEVDPLPFPGPFPAGPLAVAGGPRKTGECALGPWNSRVWVGPGHERPVWCHSSRIVVILGTGTPVSLSSIHLLISPKKYSENTFFCVSP